MDHCYDSSSKLNTPERPIRTYRRSSKPTWAKEIKVEHNIKLEPDVEIVDDYMSSEVSTNNLTESDCISIHDTFPPEMLVINIKDVMISTHFDSELLSAVKSPSICETVIKSEGPGKEGEVSNSEQVEKMRVSEEPVKPVLLTVPPEQLKRPKVVFTKPEESGAMQSNAESPEVVPLKPKSPEVVPLKPKSPEVVPLKPNSSEAVVLKPNSPEAVLLNSPEAVLPNSPETVLLKPNIPVPVQLKPNIPVPVQLKPNSPETVLLKPNSPETVLLKPNSPETVLLKPNSPETVLLKPNSAETVLLKPNSPETVLLKPNSAETVLLKPNSPETVLLKPNSPETVLLKPNSPETVLLKPNSPETVLLKPNSPETVLLKPNSAETVLLKPKSPKTVLVNRKCSVSVPLKVKSSAAAQVKPKLPRRLLPKPGISLLKLTSSEAVQSHLNTSTAKPLISSVSEVVRFNTTISKALQPNMSGAVSFKPCVSKGVRLKRNAHDIMQTIPGSIVELKLAGAPPLTAEESNTAVAKSEQPFKKPTITTAPVRPFVTEPVQPHWTEDKIAPVQASEATLVKLKRKGGTVLVMTAGHTSLRKTPSALAREPPPSEYKTERLDEILEPGVIKLNLPEYVVDYEPNSKAPALPPVALMPLIPLPLPSIIDDEPPMVIDAVKHLQEQLTPLLPRSWSLRVEKEGIFAMLFAPGLSCAVQRAVYASYDGNELRFIVHGTVVPKDHTVYEYRLMKPPLALTVETVRDFVNVVMGAIHSMIQHHVCIGINDEECVRERWNHPGCRLDDNVFGEEGYTKTLRSLQCAYLVWRKNTKRCSECLFFKTLWRNRSKRRSAHSEEDWEVREPKNRKR